MRVKRLLAAISATLLASVALAGSYTITFSGGSWASTGAGGNISGSGYGVNGNTYSQSISTGGGFWMFGIPLFLVGPGTCSLSGQLTATYTWVPASGETAQSDPPPPYLLIRENSVASYTGDSLASGDCDPGMTDNLVTTIMEDEGSGLDIGKVKTAYRYELKANPGASFTKNLTPTANSSRSSVSPPNIIGGNANVSWTLTNYALSLGLGGVTADPGDNKVRKILPGQKLTGSVVWNPSAPVTNISYSWNVTGCNPFINYIHTVSPALGQVVPYAAVTTATTVAYFSNPGSGTISCTYVFELTEAPNTRYTANLSRTVPVVDLQNVEATASASAPGSNHVLEPNGSHSINFNTMNFTGRATTPSYFAQSGDYGSWDFVQLVTSRHGTATINGVTGPIPGNFYSAKLDNTFPYDSGAAADGTQGTTNDNPGINFNAITGLTQVTIQMTFNMHWLYKPPGADSKYVSMRSKEWQWAMAATLASGWTPVGTIPVKGGGTTDSKVEATVNWPKQPEWIEVVLNG